MTLLSFSVSEMLPCIRAGIRQARGEPVRDRVKRQTIRRRGPIADRLLKWDPIAHTTPHTLHLWWKSRTAEREHLGNIPHFKIYPITILHSFSQSPGEPKEQCIKIEGLHQWRRDNSCAFWPDSGDTFLEEVLADGFDSAEAFRDYFVPNMGDVFNGVVFKW